MNNNTLHKSLINLFKSLWTHISKRRKVQFSFLLILTLIASVAEVVSLGAVLPFIGILTQPDQVFESPWLADFITLFFSSILKKKITFFDTFLYSRKVHFRRSQTS